MYTVKWSVLQYVIIRPLVSIAGIVCEKYKVLCESEGFDFRYANVYLEIVDFISIRCVRACYFRFTLIRNCFHLVDPLTLILHPCLPTPTPA